MSIEAKEGDPGASFPHEITIFSEKRCLILGTDDYDEYNDWTEAFLDTIQRYNDR